MSTKKTAKTVGAYPELPPITGIPRTAKPQAKPSQARPQAAKTVADVLNEDPLFALEQHVAEKVKHLSEMDMAEVSYLTSTLSSIEAIKSSRESAKWSEASAHASQMMQTLGKAALAWIKRQQGE
jgi:hypothetical protein